ncbi:MAG: radical SAM protein [Calditrichaceae bacterium]
MLFSELILTSKCSQRCLQCNIPQKEVVSSEIDYNDFQIIIDRLYAYGTHGIVLSGGEPTMHPNFFDILQHTIEKKFTYVHILSNLFIPKSKAEKLADKICQYNIGLTTSFDGLGSVADRIRGGKNVEKITFRNMNIIIETGKKYNCRPKISANIVISQINLHQIPEIIDRLNELDLMINIDLYRNSSVNHNQVDEMVITDYNALSKALNYAVDASGVVTPKWLLDGYIPFLENKFNKQCPYLMNTALGSKFFIQPNGEIRVCIGESIGNILQDTPDKIFASKTWRKKRDEFITCTGCWNTCYTPSARLSNYLNFTEIKNIVKIIR